MRSLELFGPVLAASLCACGVPAEPGGSSAARTGAVKQEAKQRLLSLTKDLNVQPQPGAMELRDCTDLGGRAFCVGYEPLTGTELWVADGTVAGTHVIKDVVPGVQGWIIGKPVVLGDAVFFVEDVPGAGTRIFRTDGTAAGTHELPTEGDVGYVVEIGASGGALYISATHPTLGVELWKSDGVHAPVLLKDITPGPNGSEPRNFTAVGNRLFFLAVEQGTTGLELHVTDGTTAGTKLVRDLKPGTDSWFDYTAKNNEFVAYGDVLLFRAYDSVHGWELWRSDGTQWGTALVTDLAPGMDSGLSSDTKTLTVMGSWVYFLGRTPAAGYELFRTDGTADGTRVVKDMVPGSGSAYPYRLAASADRLYFISNDGEHGREPWVSDGTEAGTFMLMDALPGPESSMNGMGEVLFVPFAPGKVLFAADAGPELGTEPFVSDGTAAGTRLLKDVAPGLSSSISAWKPNLLSAGGRALFVAEDAEHGERLWSSDGSESGTQVLFDPRLGSASLFYSLDFNSPGEPLMPLGDKVLFQADVQDGTGTELYVSDGTADGTHLVKELVPGNNSGNVLAGVRGGLEYQGALLFAGRDTADENYELWRSDGTAEGTFRVADINPGPAGSYPYRFVACNGYVYFMALRADVGQELFRTDGTAGGTQLVRDLVPGPDHSSPYFMACAANGKLALSAGGAGAGRELWVSDGTENGTTLFDLQPGGTGSQPNWLTPMGEYVYFVASADKGAELYRVKPGAGAPELVRDLLPGPNSGFNYEDPQFTVAGGKLYFSADVGNGLGRELWVTDGTWEGTQQLADACPGACGSQPHSLVALGARLLFLANDGVHGDEPWVSAGTRTTTRMVKDVFPGSQSGAFRSPMVALSEYGVALFTGVDPEGGAELWRTDGTADGTVRVEDALPGVLSLEPFMPVRAGARVYFRGFTKEAGREVWSGAVADLGDKQVPAVMCPPEWKVEAQDAHGAEVTLPVIEVADADVVMDRADGFYVLGRTPVNVTATDAVGNVSRCSFDVAVADTTAPALSCPADVTVKDGAGVTYAAGATDAVSAVEVFYSVEPGTRLPDGTTEVRVRARDAAGNEARCAFKVTVERGLFGCSAASGAGPEVWVGVMALWAAWRFSRSRLRAGA